MNGSSSSTGTPAKARRTGKPSPSKPEGAVVSRRTARNSVVGASSGRRGSTRTSSTVMAGISGLPHFFENPVDDLELVGVETIDEAVPDGDQVQRGGRLEGGQSLVGEHRLLAATVLGAGLLGDEAPLDHRVDLIRDAAGREPQRGGQLAHAQPAAGRLGQMHQDVVVVHAEAGLGAQIILERRVQGPRALDERAPGTLFVVGQRIGHAETLTPSNLK